MYRQELQFLFPARYLMMLYISMNFHENILNGFWVKERTWSYRRISKGNDSKLYRQELRFLCSARRLMMLNISIKVHENILNGFQVVERTRFYHCRISKGNYSKIVWTRVTILVFCTSPDDALYLVMGPKKKQKEEKKLSGKGVK